MSPPQATAAHAPAKLLHAYHRALVRHGASDEILDKLDLGNSFLWLFRLDELLALARRKFVEVNQRFFEGKLPTPTIAYCARATGGYYNSRKHLIAISLPMAIECSEEEFFETVLHEIAHIAIRNHSPKFYALLRTIGGAGGKAPMTHLLRLKRETHRRTNYPVVVECPNCRTQSRYKTRRALRYACSKCCVKFNRGKFDERFRLRLVATHLVNVAE